jgi:dipeptidase E
MHLLLLSNSTNTGGQYLEHATEYLAAALAGIRTIAFVPYAAVRFDYDDYAERVQRALDPLGVQVQSVHAYTDAARVVSESEAVAVGGGNTFRLVEQLYANGLIDPIRAKVRSGAPYIGWSAGSNVACPTLRTTNDMPIVAPASFETLGLVPFQINPHYLDAHPDGHMGESREDRILEFCTLSPEVHVVGLREGSALHVRGPHVTLLGDLTARRYRGLSDPCEHDPEDPMDFLMNQAS